MHNRTNNQYKIEMTQISTYKCFRRVVTNLNIHEVHLWQDTNLIMSYSLILAIAMEMFVEVLYSASAERLNWCCLLLSSSLSLLLF